MTRTDRLLAVVLELQGRERTTAASLARQFGASERTVYRDAGVSVWFRVPDADAYHAQVAAAGAQITQAPQDGPSGRLFTIRPPGGHALTFHQTGG